MIDRQEARSDVARIDPAADRWLHTANNGEHGARARRLFINRSKIHRSSIKQYEYYPERLLSVVGALIVKE
jgi:hypothetical protein